MTTNLMADEKGISAWMRANSNWLFGVLGIVGVGGGVSYEPLLEYHKKNKEAKVKRIQLQGYEKARKEFRPKLDSVQQVLFTTQLDNARTIWELDICKSAAATAQPPIEIQSDESGWGVEHVSQPTDSIS